MLSNYILVAPEMCGRCFIYNTRNVSLPTVADISRAYFIRLGSTCWWTLNLRLGFALLTSLVYLTVLHSCFSTSECFRTDLVSMSYFGPYLFPHHSERVAQRLWAPVLQLVYKTSSKSEEIIM